MIEKTVRILADEIGVSKQRIQQVIDKLPENQSPKKRGNRYVLSELDEINIKIAMGLLDPKLANTANNNVHFEELESTNINKNQQQSTSNDKNRQGLTNNANNNIRFEELESTNINKNQQQSTRNDKNRQGLTNNANNNIRFEELESTNINKNQQQSTRNNENQQESENADNINSNPNFNSIFDLIKKEISEKNEQIKEKDKQITQLQKLLENQQVLTLQAQEKIKLLEESKIEEKESSSSDIFQEEEPQRQGFFAKWFK